MRKEQDSIFANQSNGFLSLIPLSSSHYRFSIRKPFSMAESLLFSLAESFIGKVASRAVEEASLALGVYDHL
jgi:hypothetical protein